MKSSNHRRRSHNATLETLEDRRLFSAVMSGSQLIIDGTHVSKIDVIDVAESGGNIVVSEGTTGEVLQPTAFFPAAAVSSIMIRTGEGADRITINTARETHTFAGSGNDTVIIGNSTFNNRRQAIDGGENDDLIIAGAGNDYLSGRAGNDTIAGGNGNDVINGHDGNDYVYGETGDDHVSGDFGNDHLSGGDGHDVLADWYGNDTLYGGAGNDRLSDSLGVNWFYGEAGDDTFTCGSTEMDVINGGAGNDTANYRRTGAYNPMSSVEVKTSFI
jgi:Ca2+-binding RTX toxin-like protein